MFRLRNQLIFGLVLAVFALSACEINPIPKPTDSTPNAALPPMMTETTVASEQLPDVTRLASASGVTSLTFFHRSDGPHAGDSFTANYYLMREADSFKGSAEFTVFFPGPEQKAKEELDVPLSAIEKFLQMLSKSRVGPRISKAMPTIEHGPDTFSMEIRIGNSYSHFDLDGIVWIVVMDNYKQGMIEEPTPWLAFFALQPFLKQDVLEKMQLAARNRK